jgi:formate dehydrogenase major subunit
MGLDWNYAGPHEVFAEMKLGMPSLNNITWDRLEAENAVTYPCDAPDKPGNVVVFGDGFPTPSRRARLVPAKVISPAETPDEEFPMVLTTGRQLEHWHTGAMTRHAQVLDTLAPEPLASLHPDDARALGIADGAPIEVATRHGAVRAVAQLTPEVQPGQVFMAFAYWEAAANRLTGDALDPVAKIPGFKVTAVRVAAA